MASAFLWFLTGANAFGVALCLFLTHRIFTRLGKVVVATGGQVPVSPADDEEDDDATDFPGGGLKVLEDLPPWIILGAHTDPTRDCLGPGLAVLEEVGHDLRREVPDRDRHP